MHLDTHELRQHLQALDFRTLFVEGLGWSLPSAEGQPARVTLGGVELERRRIAELGGVVVVELRVADGPIPNRRTCEAVQREVSQQHFENLLIFVDANRSQSLWYWVKRDGSKRFPREHLYVKGQPGDLFLSKIAPLFVDISELDEFGGIDVLNVATRLRDALDVERVTRKFYEEYRDEHLRFTELIGGIDDERERRWYASVLLNRLMFVYFLQRKGFLDGARLDYLRDKLTMSRARGGDLFYQEFLRALFFEGFAKPASERSAAATALVGDVVYLNGGLFLPHPIEQRWPGITIPDAAFDNLFSLFGRYSWNLDDTPGGADNEINPDVLGYIFEKYINQKAYGAYYTPPEITEYLCRQTIHKLVLDRMNQPAIPGIAPARQFDSMTDLLTHLDAPLCRELLDTLPKLSLLDPACGSGAFLIAALKTLVDIYSAAIGRAEFLADPTLKRWLADLRKDHRSLNYHIKKQIIVNNLYGVDIMEEATEIARLRLFLALVSSVTSVEELEPLPNIDFNILTGNSLIGLLRVDEQAYDRRHRQLSLFSKPYSEIVAEKNRMVQSYRAVGGWHKDLRSLRDAIEQHRAEAQAELNQLLLDEFLDLKIKVEEATWDPAKGAEGKPKKRAPVLADIAALTPFHWGYEFDQVMNERGGFDAIITNPPWEILKPNSKEFFQEHSELVTINKMRTEEFEKEKATLLWNPAIRDAWLEYLTRFPHQSAWFRSAPQYVNQISVVNGKKQGTDINLYKLFLEQCFNLLRPGGDCGIVIPSGIYTDLGTKQLRELLFNETRITGLFGFENRKMIFDAVDSRFKFVVLSFTKGGETASLPTAFMRHDVAELERFPEHGALEMPVALVRRLSPDSLSIMEFKSDLDIQIAEKMLRFPLLGDEIEGTWNIKLGREFDMVMDSHLFLQEPAPGRLALYEGKMAHQFTLGLAPPRYWIDEHAGRKALIGRGAESGQLLDYQDYRLAFRRIGRNTDSRTLIATILPKNVFASESFNLASGRTLWHVEQLALTSLLNSFVIDFYIRHMVTANINMFFVYQLPVPRITEKDPKFRPIIERAAKLICTSPEFDDLAREVGMPGHDAAGKEPTMRAQLRAELDGLVAHLYRLTREEFEHILDSFPLIAAEVKEAALIEYDHFAPSPDDPFIIDLIAQGESDRLEFKESVRWDTSGAKQGEKACWKTVAAFLNSDGGDLLLGVNDVGQPTGVQVDIATLNKHPDMDGYLQFLTQLFIGVFGEAALDYIRITPHSVGGVQVCRVAVEPAPVACWARDGKQEHFFIRAGNTTRELAGRALAEYVRGHWR